MHMLARVCESKLMRIRSPKRERRSPGKMDGIEARKTAGGMITAAPPVTT
jgi:hypothetical protein